MSLPSLPAIVTIYIGYIYACYKLQFYPAIIFPTVAILLAFGACYLFRFTDDAQTKPVTETLTEKIHRQMGQTNKN